MSDEPNQQDQIIDLMLSECLGGEYPPDLTQQILRRVDAEKQRFWRFRLVGYAGLAAAACLLLTMWALRPDNGKNGYPMPTLGHGVSLVSGDLSKPGASIASAADPGQLTLGNYCAIKLSPHTRIDLTGSIPKVEAIRLQEGGVDCDITPNMGSFQVVTAVGTVQVIGTQFRVSLEKAAAGARQPASEPQLRVAVSKGVVRVSGSWGTANVTAGQERLFPTVAPVPALVDENMFTLRQRLAQLNIMPGFSLSPQQKQAIINIYAEWSQQANVDGPGRLSVGNSASFVRRVKALLTSEQLEQYKHGEQP